jgi:hypothetical protein
MEAHVSLNENHLDLVSRFTGFGGARQWQPDPPYYRSAPIRVINDAGWQVGVVSVNFDPVRVIFGSTVPTLNKHGDIHLKI